MFNKSNSNGQTRKASRAFEAAIAGDNAWFAANPDKTSRRRRVYRAELPRQFRNLGIREVVIERIGPAEFIRRWLDIDGRTVMSGSDHYDDLVVPGAPQKAARLVLRPDGSAGPPIGAGPRGPESDREYFKQHPGATEFTRPATAAEMAAQDVPPGGEWIEAVVTVAQVMPGVRLRRFDGAYRTPDGIVERRAQ
jgi:hypothetical protein